MVAGASAPVRRVTPVHAARRRTATDHARYVGIAIGANALILMTMWWMHGGLDSLAERGAGATAIGQATALLGTYAALVEILFMSRISWLERCVGFDRLAVWHRWLGFAAVSLLTAHVVASTYGFAESSGRSLVQQTQDFISHYPDVLMAYVGFGLFIAVAVSSARAARRRLRRETWYALHLYAYLAIALSFAHQLAVGTDFTDDPVERAWWVGLYVAIFGSILVWRVGGPIVFNVRHRLVVAKVSREANGVVSVYMTGRRLTEIDVESGQFFLWRFLTGSGWAKAHPFSLSAAPNNRFLRITVKELGDDTQKLQRLHPGVRVFAEGPYGTFTSERITRSKVALIAGGIGITPLRALFETLPATTGEVTLLYRVATPGDLALKRELDLIAQQRGVTVHHLIGTEIGDDTTDQLGVPALGQLVPDIADRDVFLCGPPAFLTALRRRVAALGTPRHRIHFERFEY
jgi:predicted ferric reductase